jgi:hypothetical protein
VTATPVRLDYPGRPGALLIRNVGVVAVFFGTDDQVTSSTGLQLGIGETLALDLYNTAADGVWAVTAPATTCVVHALQIRNHGVT